MFDQRPREHTCLNGIPSEEPSWWLKDGRGVELCRVCDRCEDEKKARYRPEVLGHYDENDVDEPIEAEDGSGW